jgi:hypothetical protein
MNLNDLPRTSKILKPRTSCVPELPEKIYGSYIDDYDIIEIHRIIGKYFEYQTKINLELLNKELIDINAQLNKPQIYIYKCELESKKNSIMYKINNIQNNIEKENYIQECKNYLIIYQKLKMKTIHNNNIVNSDDYNILIDFLNNIKDDLKLSELSDLYKITGIKITSIKDLYDYRHEIINNYIEYAKKYFPIEIVRLYKNNSTCSCGTTEEFSHTISGSSFCNSCGEYKQTYVRIFSGMDIGISAAKEDNYDGIEGFKDAFLEYQGKQKKYPPQQLYQDLDKHFSSFNLPTKYNPNIKIQHDDRGRIPGTTKQLMYEALKITGNSIYFNLINTICHEYWGWILPNISDVDSEILLDDYRLAQNAWDKLTHKSKILIPSRLYFHLKSRGHRCYIDDFKLIVNSDIMSSYIETWKEMINNIEYPQNYPHKKLTYVP